MMRWGMHSKWLLSGILFLTGLLSCSTNSSDELAGTATDAENTVAGVVLDSVGAPVAGVEVRLVTDSIGFASPVLRLAKSIALNLDSTGDVRVVFTDSMGHYAFEGVDSSLIFNLSLSYQSLDGIYFASHVASVGYNSPLVRQIQLNHASAASGTLEYVRGTDSRYQFSNHFYATVAGTGRIQSVFAGRPFTITGIPFGYHQLILFPADKGMVQALLDEGLPMDSMVTRLSLQFPLADTVELGRVPWKLPAAYQGEPPPLEDTTDTAGSGPDPLPEIRTMSGLVLSYLGEPVEGAEVRLVLDTLGFDYADGLPAGDSLVTVTDESGRWTLPIPAEPAFGLEFLKLNKADSLVGYGLLARLRTPLASVKTMKVDSMVLLQPARIEGMIRYTEEPNAWIDIGSHFRIGIKGTTRYVDVIAGQQFSLTGLPSGTQTLVYYPGDSFLWPTFQNELGSMAAMVGSTEFVVLAPGTVQELQVDTYTLPEP